MTLGMQVNKLKRGYPKLPKDQCTSMAQLGIPNFQTKWHQFEPISTILYETVKKNPLQLCQKLDNIVLHYKNEHQNCFLESRCRKDENYQPSKMVIKNPQGVSNINILFICYFYLYSI